MTATFGARTPLRLLGVGDIGRSDAYHVGDESMMLGLIEIAKGSGIETEWTLMSAEPARSADQFGVRAAPRWGFDSCSGPADRERLLTEIDQFLQASPSRGPAAAPARWRETLAAIAESDAVVIAGGGNLCRSWPAEVFERAAVARAARWAGRPVAITSQTIGPSFDDRTRELTAEILGCCVFVGMRERHSYELALELGAPHDRTVLQIDDAMGVAAAEPARASGIAGNGDFIAVTLNQLDVYGRDIVVMLAQQLAELSRCTGAAVVMVPHVADLNGAPTHDVAMARAVVEAAGNTASVQTVPLPSPAQAVWFSAHAQIVVSTRYHPVVFAIATTTPALFLSQDHYTMVKGQGALGLVGLESWTLPVGRAASGLLLPAALELWDRRRAVREHLQDVAPAIEQLRREHVAALFRALMHAGGAHAAAEPITAWRGPVARGEWVTQVHEGRAIAESRRDTDTLNPDASMVRQQLGTAEEYARALAREVERKEADLVIAHDALANASSVAEKAHLAWQAERASMQQQLALVEGRAISAEQWAGVLAAEMRRKEADLLTAHSALEEIEKRRANRDAPSKVKVESKE